MINREHNSKKKQNRKTILLLVDCLPGALRAGRFVLNNLYDSQTRIILLQTFNIQGFGLFMMRDLSQKLREISLYDLTVLKNSLIEEFGIPSRNIKKLAIEGDLATIVNQKFRKDNNLSVVVGSDRHQVINKTTNKHTISFIKKSIIRPIFLIEDNITLIDRSKIIIVSDNPDQIPELTKKILVDISEKDDLEIEYATGKKNRNTSIPHGTARFFSKDIRVDSPSLNIIERIIQKKSNYSNPLPKVVTE